MRFPSMGCGRMIARAMFGAIVVGTDGSATASEAVRQATELARIHGARVHVVSAYEPVGSARLREERDHVPDEMQWMVNPREDVEKALTNAASTMGDAGVECSTYARQ